MSEPPILHPSAKLASVDKPPRPPHVIVLADSLAEASKLPGVGGLVVAWYSPDDEGENAITFRTLGSDDAVIGLCERLKFLTMCGGGERDMPSDAR